MTIIFTLIINHLFFLSLFNYGNTKYGDLDNIIMNGPQLYFLDVPESVLSPNVPKALENENIDSGPEGIDSFFISAADHQ